MYLPVFSTSGARLPIFGQVYEACSTFHKQTREKRRPFMNKSIEERRRNTKSVLLPVVRRAPWSDYKLLNTTLTLPQHLDLKDVLPLGYEKDRAMFSAAWLHF